MLNWHELNDMIEELWSPYYLRPTHLLTLSWHNHAPLPSLTFRTM
jgi:hypothetical protein